MLRKLIAILGVAIFSEHAMAQNTGGVFSPNVSDGHKSAQFRVAVDLDELGDTTRLASRIHYQQSLNGDVMWRVVAQGKDAPGTSFDLDFLQAELLLQLTEDGAEHAMGLRFDARVREGKGAEQLGFNWMNEFRLSPNWSLRAVGLSSVQIGDRASDGVNLQTRWRLSQKLENGHQWGIDMFNNYGNTGNIGDFDKQSHTVGPFYAMPLTENISVFAGPLFGFSKASPDAEARIWLTRGF